MADAIVVLKNILHDLKSFFKKVQKGELVKYTISTRVSTSLEETENLYQSIRIKLKN